MLAIPKVVVEIAFPNDPGDASFTWTDVTSYVWEAHSRRGREDRLDRVESASCDFILDNRDRRFEPDYTASPHYPNVRSMKRIRIRAGENLVANPSFEDGTTTGWQTVYGTESVSVVTEDAAIGARSARVICNVNGGQGMQLGFISLGVGGSTLGLVRTFSIYFKAPAGKTIRIEVSENGGATGASTTTQDFTATGKWQRGTVSRTFTAADRTTYTARIYMADSLIGDRFYLDAAQVTDSPGEKVYVDAPAGIFQGFITEWPVKYRGRGAIINVRAVDLFEALANRRISGAFAAAISGTRIGALLDAFGWPSGQRAIDAGVDNVQGVTLDREPVLQAIKEAADAELGAFFIDGNGLAVFHGRTRRSTSPGNLLRAVFSTNPTPSTLVLGFPIVNGNEIIMLDVEPESGVQYVANEVVVEPPGLLESVASDAASQGDYFVRTLARAPILTSQSAATDQANYLLATRKGEKIRIPRLALDPRRDERAWSQMIGREIGDKIRVIHVPTPGGAAITVDAHIEAVAQDLVFRPGEAPSWVASFALSPSDAASYWLLNDATYSILDSTTVLGY